MKPSMSLVKRSPWLRSRWWVISWTTMYSRQSGCFFASSTLNQMCPVSRLHEPHFVFMRRMLQRGTETSRTGSHLVIRSGTAARSCWRYHWSSSFRRLSLSVPSGDVEQQAVAVDLDMWPAGPFDHLEPMADAPHVVGFAGDHLTSGAFSQTAVLRWSGRSASGTAVSA